MKKINAIKIMKVKSDNFTGYMCASAYHELTLRMSSGDFGAHKARVITTARINTLIDTMMHLSKKIEGSRPHKSYHNFDVLFELEGEYWTSDQYGDLELLTDWMQEELSVCSSCGKAV